MRVVCGRVPPMLARLRHQFGTLRKPQKARCNPLADGTVTPDLDIERPGPIISRHYALVPFTGGAHEVARVRIAPLDLHLPSHLSV